MTKKYAVIFAVLALFVAGVSLLRAAEGVAGSWTGEVIDVACYSTHGSKGADHMECGAKCIKSGLPVGLLVNGTTYLLINSDHTPLNEKLAAHVGHTVTVNGTKHESPGANVIVVKDWAMAK